jgi:predicted hydrocarbon binding protein/KaiC/GvpD/RAD55 family RecA-like ATPase
MVSLTELQEVPPENMILLVGPPGSGKSAFCEQAILQSLALDRPIIYVTTDCDPSRVEKALKEMGLSEFEPGVLNFIDAYNETVGLLVSDRPDTVRADCASLSSIGIAISKLQERIGRKGVLLVFDSLTSPYLLSGPEIVRFMRLTLSRFVGEGNSVLACFDEGSGKKEDVVTMMSIADGVIKIETEEEKRRMNVMKHPRLNPTRINVPITPSIGLEARLFDTSVLREILQTMMVGGKSVMRSEVGDYVNLFWPNLAHWSGMLWDPKRFPTMTYEMNKEDPPSLFKMSKEDEAVKSAYIPWRMRLLMNFIPKSFSKVKDMKRGISRLCTMERERERVGIMEYLEGSSKTDEHYFRVHESSDCWGFENIGAPIASYLPSLIAGMCKGIEFWKGLERDWNAVETKCIGLGDPYCEFKLVPGEIDELRCSLEKDSSIIESIHNRLMDHLMGHLLHGKPLVERPRLGSDVYIHYVFHAMAFPAMAGERYQIALRMGGAKAGKEVGEHLIEAGLMEDESVKRILNLLDHCKVGKISMDETIRIKENCESSQTKLFATKIKEPSCYFTTGFLNGFFSAVKNQHVKETKCIAMGDPYCEWEFR